MPDSTTQLLPANAALTVALADAYTQHQQTPPAELTAAVRRILAEHAQMHAALRHIRDTYCRQFSISPEAIEVSADSDLGRVCAAIAAAEGR